MISIWFDGLCEPNPDGVATYGFLITGIPNGPDVSGCGVLGAGRGMTNNAAEWCALGKALAYIVAARVPVDELQVFGDSKLVIEQLKGNWQCNVPRLVEFRDRCRELLKLIGKPAKASWVPRGQNVAADHLSRAAYVGRVGRPVPERPKK